MAHEHWYRNTYRRNLVDMHIEDWDARFLSEFSPEDYVENLRRAHIKAPMLYLQSHVGHCYWPTKTGHMHAALNGREDLMRRTADCCHAAGMYVVGYYSLIYNTVEEDRHPDWKIVCADGKSRRDRGSRYGLCCPNNPEYRAFVIAQIEEMAEYFDLDGLFFDMTFWPEVCHCEHCQKRYLAETGRDALEGGTLPAVDWNDPAWLEFQQLRNRWMGEFAALATKTAKRCIPGVSVEHNYASAIAGSSLLCNTELVNDQCDYAGGDLYGDLYNHSFTAKYYYSVTNNQPFEYMTCRCDRSLYVHTVSKTEEHLATEVMLTAAHHGASFIIDAIDPVGTLDARVYDLVGRVFERQMPYEPYFSGDLVQDIGVYYTTTGHYNSRGLPYDNKTCAIGITRALIEENIPVGVFGNRQTGDLSRYRMVMAPQLGFMDEENLDDLARYVEDGGILYLSGVEDKRVIEQLLDARFVRYTEDNAVYMAPTACGQSVFGPFTQKYPFPTETSLPVIEVEDAQILATMTMPYTKPSERRFASIHSNPPGIPTDIPALLAKHRGKGIVIWCAAPIENDNRRSHRRLLLSIIERYVDLQALSVRSDAPRQVELVTFRRAHDTLVSAVDLLCTDELLPVPGFGVSVKCDAPSRIIRIGGRDRDDTEIPFTYRDGYAEFRVEDLVMFEMYRIE
ncbi:MAG: alpha-L-fucosidase [Clostridia bacterium]|nr:alpha-L-fucosidase [Clostridia bacterium]